MRKKQTKDYSPKRISDTHWEVDKFFINHWLIRGDIESQSDGTYIRTIDDCYLKDHLKGHTYKVKE